MIGPTCSCARFGHNDPPCPVHPGGRHPLAMMPTVTSPSTDRLRASWEAGEISEGFEPEETKTKVHVTSWVRSERVTDVVVQFDDLQTSDIRKVDVPGDGRALVDLVGDVLEAAGFEVFRYVHSAGL